MKNNEYCHSLITPGAEPAAMACEDERIIVRVEKLLTTLHSLLTSGTMSSSLSYRNIIVKFHERIKQPL